MGTRQSILCSHSCPEPFYSLTMRPFSAVHCDPATQEASPFRVWTPWQRHFTKTIVLAFGQCHCPGTDSLLTFWPHSQRPSLDCGRMRALGSHRKQRTERHGAMEYEQRSCMVWVAAFGCEARLSGRRWWVGRERFSPIMFYHFCRQVVPCYLMTSPS